MDVKLGIYKEERCNWCGEPAKTCCSSCNEVWYCSKLHKLNDWGYHYRECKPYKVVSSPEAGQFIVASRDMKPGTLVLQDDPMVVGPLAISELMCLGCHKPISEETFEKCPDCSWPICSIECIDNISHEEECKILSKDVKKCGVPQVQGSTPRYDLIFILRCLLLKTTNPKAWELFQSMESHSNEMEREAEPHHVAAVRYFTEICTGDFDIETVNHVRGVIVTNTLEIRGPRGGKLRALYPNISLLNHSCLPNIHLTSTIDDVMEARSAVSVRKSEPLYISYTETTAPLWERQTCLANAYHFTCSCKRCSDGTELGTSFSSPKCPQCLHVILSTQINQESIAWHCSKCGTTSSLEEICQEIEDWLFRLEMNDLFGSGTPPKISSALAVIENRFHHRHFVWLKAAQLALCKLHYDEKYSALRLKKEIWEKILELYNILEPGLTRRRGKRRSKN